MAQSVVILGAGPSGLGVAWGLVERGITDISIVERRETTGGLSGTMSLNGVDFDYGPHRLSPEYPDILDRIKNLLGEDLQKLPNEHAVVFRDRVYQYPPRIKDFLHWNTLSFSGEVLSSYAFRKLRRFPKGDFSNDTFRDRIEDSFGPCLYQEVVSPLCEKVWGNPEELAPSFAKTRFSVPTFVQWGRRWLGDPAASRDKWFYYPTKGFQQIWEKLTEHLRGAGVKFYLNSEARSVESAGNRIHSVAVKSEVANLRLPCDWLVSTIPSHALLSLLGLPQEVPLPTARGMFLVVFVLKRENVLPARVVLLPEKKYLFNRLSEQSQFSQAMTRPGSSVVIADLLADTDDPIWNGPEENILKRVREQVLSLGFFKDLEIENHFLVRVPDAYPVPTKDNEERQLKLNAQLSKWGNLIATGRLASSDYNNSHSALKKGLELAAFISADRDPEEWYPYAEKFRQVPIRD